MSPAPNPSFPHLPVMATEVLGLLDAVPPGLVLDATVGGGGHAAMLLAARPDLRLLGLDQDPDAVAAAKATLAPYGQRVEVVRARFDTLAGVVAAHLDAVGGDVDAPAALSAALFDLGVSSPQLDRAERGFSYRADAPLDMRMDPGRPGSAADLVNGAAPAELVALLAANGEGRFARRIVRAIIDARPVQSTGELADVVRDALPAAVRRQGGHPARRVFQALRIAVNRELDVLPGAIDDAVSLLAPGGRIVVLSYHSGEDRIVKDRLREASTGGCRCPPGLPCACGAVPRVALLNRRAQRPGPDEVASNRRSESARLRAAERLDGSGGVADASPLAMGRVAARRARRGERQ